MPGSVEAEWAGERFTLLPHRAAFWHRRRAVVIADAHFGKSDHFRQAGIPVPSGTTDHGLARLTHAVHACDAREVIILGDLFHARGGMSETMLEALRAWRESLPSIAVTVVTGNHDRHAGGVPKMLGFTDAGDELRDGDLLLRHHPEPRAGACVMAGHIHPMVALSDGLSSLRAPCFHFGRDVAVLPAFGAFTGGKAIRPRAGDQVYAVGPDCVTPIPIPRL